MPLQGLHFITLSLTEVDGNIFRTGSCTKLLSPHNYWHHAPKPIAHTIIQTKEYQLRDNDLNNSHQLLYGSRTKSNPSGAKLPKRLQERSKAHGSFNNLIGFCVRQVKITSSELLGEFGCFTPRKVVHLRIDNDSGNTIGLDGE